MLQESEMPHTTTCIYTTLFFATFYLFTTHHHQPINLATHINSEVEEAGHYHRLKFMIFFCFFSSCLFTALELWSGSNRPQAKRIRQCRYYFFCYLSCETQMQFLGLLQGVTGNQQPLGMVTKHWAEDMFDFFISFSL
jgi:hypothetical protein